MTSINDKRGTTVAYLHNNIIVDVNSENVVGVVLGNCVFGDAEQPIGKYFNNTFRDINGKVIGVTGGVKKTGIKINELIMLEGAWKILNKVKEHVCGWIKEVEEWADITFSEFLHAKNNNALGMS
jgi:hypothetical protein